MKVKQLTKLLDVLRIELIIKDELLYFSRNSLIKKNRNSKQWEIEFNPIPSTNFIDKNNYTLYSINTNLYTLNLETGSTSLIQKFDFYPISKFNTYLLGYRFGKFHIFDFEKKQIITSTSYEGNINCICKELFIITNSSSLSCYSLINGSQIWSKDLSDKSKYQDEKGNWQRGIISKTEIFERTLVVLLGNDTLIGLDIATGEVKWEQAMPTRILTPAAFANDKIYWFALGNNPIYMVVDMVTGAIEKTVVPDAQINQRLVFSQPFVTDDFILMTSVSTHEIFILNKDSLAIESITKLEECINRIPIDNSPQLIDGRVYQLNGDNTLYIFEKD